jgi:hypothetical protein
LPKDTVISFVGYCTLVYAGALRFQEDWFQPESTVRCDRYSRGISKKITLFAGMLRNDTPMATRLMMGVSAIRLVMLVTTAGEVLVYLTARRRSAQPRSGDVR